MAYDVSHWMSETANRSRPFSEVKINVHNPLLKHTHTDKFLGFLPEILRICMVEMMTNWKLNNHGDLKKYQPVSIWKFPINNHNYHKNVHTPWSVRTLILDHQVGPHQNLLMHSSSSKQTKEKIRLRKSSPLLKIGQKYQNPKTMFLKHLIVSDGTGERSNNFSLLFFVWLSDVDCDDNHLEGTYQFDKSLG